MNVIFIPECYADTTLTDFFLRNKDLRIHQRGIAKVASIMEKGNSKYFRIVGIIDADKRLPKNLNDLINVTKNASILNNHNFKRLLKSLQDSEDFKALEHFISQLQHF